MNAFVPLKKQILFDSSLKLEQSHPIWNQFVGVGIPQLVCCFQRGDVHWDINVFGDEDDGRMVVGL